MKKHNITETLDKLGIKDIYFDSRKATDGSAFFCIQYAQHYIQEAIDNGVRLIVCNTETHLDNDVHIIIVHDVRGALAEAAAFLYPQKPQYMAAVTGTSGKTSVVDYFRQIAGCLGYKAASIGTIGIYCSDPSIVIDNPEFTTNLTTPDVITMHKILCFLASKGVTHVAFEASSHGIDQRRIAEIFVNTAAFTSFSQDHLDYHNTIEAYKFAKLKLFSENLQPNATAVVANELMDDHDIQETFAGNGSFSNPDISLVSVGKHGIVDIVSCIPDITGQKVTFSYQNKEYNISTPIIGSFQATNLLIAASMLEACGIKFEDIARVLPKITAVAGRLERITDLKSPWHVFVDYAHKTGALEQTLSELRLLCKNKLHVVFGCGGDRDKTKRKIMGEIAARIADNVIITDDNPRTENPSAIRQDVLSGCAGAKEIGNRAEAIKYAISQLTEGDILVIAGKGNEDYQIIGTTKTHFDDREEVRKWL